MHRLEDFVFRKPQILLTNDKEIYSSKKGEVLIKSWELKGFK